MVHGSWVSSRERACPETFAPPKWEANRRSVCASVTMNSLTAPAPGHMPHGRGGHRNAAEKERTMTRRQSQPFVCVTLTLGAVLLATVAGSGAERKRFKADFQTTSQFVPIQFVEAHRCDDERGHQPVVGLLRVIGSGDASFLGSVIDEQSHCVRADFTFFNGRF